MPSAQCGFLAVPGGASGSDMLCAYGPTILVNIGFDSAYKAGKPSPPPVAGITGIRALVDSGATESDLDSVLAAQLNLPIIDKRTVGGIGGSQQVNVHLAQVHIPSLSFTIYGSFAKAIGLGSSMPSWRSGNTHGFCVTGGHSPIASGPTPSRRLWAAAPGATPALRIEHTTGGRGGHSKPERSTLLESGTFYFALTFFVPHDSAIVGTGVPRNH